jgi:uncharacterized membrane protein YhhN
VLAAIGVAAAGVYLAALALDLPGVRMAAKPLPVLCLLAWVGIAGNLPRRVLIAGGLAWSAVGDVLLAMIDLGGDAKAFFALGLGAFLIAHLCYIGFFVSWGRRLNPLRLLPFAAWGATVFVLVRPNLGDLTIPVIVYMLVILTMMWRAFSLTDGYGRSVSLAQTAGWGALLFGLSDSLIALNKFWQPLPGAAYAIILTYWLGQIGIARSARG